MAHISPCVFVENQGQETYPSGISSIFMGYSMLDVLHSVELILSDFNHTNEPDVPFPDALHKYICKSMWDMICWLAFL